MEPITPSNLTYPNKLMIAFYNGLEETLGENGARTVLNLSGLGGWLKNPPKETMARGIDFAEIAAIMHALEFTTGEKASHGLARVAGADSFFDIQPIISAQTGDLFSG